MKIFFYAPILFAVLSLSACSSSRVILLDNGKAQNAVVVTTKQGQQVLDKKNTYLDISATGSSAVKPISPQQVQQTYGTLLAAAPKAPISFLLYFETDSTSLTAASQRQLPTISSAIKERIPCDINVIGHADRTGTKAYNIDLSLRRARQIRDWLYTQKLDISTIIVESYGEEDPLVPTADGIPEPRNRRVEILIR